MGEAVEKRKSDKPEELPTPAGWTKRKLLNVINPRGEKVSPADFPDKPFIGMDHVEAHTTKIIGSTPAHEMKSSAARFYKNDVLYGRLRPYLNKVAQPKEDGLASAEFIVFPQNKIIESRFLKYRLNSRDFVSFANHLNEGDRPRVNFEQIGEFQLLLPPFAEQQRIVAKIEELFSELDKGVESLRTAQQQLKVYHQTLLKHAFEGKLTADWRAQNPDKLESGDALLARIRQEREARYQQQLQEWQAAQKSWGVNDKTGRKPSKPKIPKILPALSAEELTELPELPEGWVYVPLSYLGELGRGKSKHRPRNDPKLFGGPYPFIQTGEVKAANRIIRQYSNTYSELGLEQSKLWPQGTLCITIAANIAETAFLGFDGCFPDSIVGFSALHELIAPEYVDFFIKGARTRIEAYAPATAQKNINLETLENLIIPLCGGEEQKALLQALDEKFSILDQLEQTIVHSLQQAEALRQSILKKAFSGQLVAQDANDEPASVLLERIKAEKQAKPAAGKRTQRTAPAALPNDVVPMPARIPGIASTDLHAGILALAYSAHETEPKYLPYFGHVKGEKVSHLVEAHLGIELDRAPVKDAAGPNDYPHLKKVESRARKVGWFDMRREPGATAYSLHKLAGFNELQVKTRQALGPMLSEVEALLRLLLPLNTRQAEIVATLYAAWNNLLLDGHQPSDQQIIFEARDNWHPDKLKIEQERFEKGLSWMKAKGLIPNGQGRSVKSKPA